MPEPTSPTTIAVGEVIAKKYEIVRPLGEGPTASTFVARHLSSGKDLAIRFIQPALVAAPKDRERLKQLFERARTLRHDLLVRYGELGIHGDRVYLTEEYFASESLREVVDKNVAENKSFTLQEACQLVISVLEAVEVAHNSGLVHRNLKPENVLVATKRTGPAANAKVIRTVKISGTGLAGILASSTSAETFTTRDEAPYLAPEISSYDQDCGPQADVYSVGVMLYELLCGQRPVGTYISPTQLREDLPAHVDDIVEIALAHNPDDRYPTARDMINDIQRSFSLEMQSGSTVVSFRNIMIILVAAIITAVGIGGYLLTSGKPDPIAEAKRQDEDARRTVRAQNPLPDEAVIKTMVAQHKEMVYVPQGTFIRGRYGSESPDMATSSEPLREVVKVPAFFMDHYEFPNKPDTKPAVRATWDQAREACATIGKRLCTDVEWEKACKGPENSIHAYGDNFDPACGAEVGGDYILGQRSECISGYGVYDLSSGLREWTSTANARNEARKMVKGGLRASPARGTRCAFAVDESAVYSEATLGFRCCLNADGTAGDSGATVSPPPPNPAVPPAG